MKQPFEYVRAVDDPVKFIRENVESKPSGLRMLLRDMQSRKRAQGESKDKKMLNEVSPSAYMRSVRRRKGEILGSLERETAEDKDLKKLLRLND